MYKSRFRLWIVVLVIYLLAMFIIPDIYSVIKEEAHKYDNYPDSITISSDNTFIKRAIANESVKKTELIVSNKNPDVMISSKEEKNSKLFYSPLVMYIDNDYYDEDCFTSINNNVNTVDLYSVLNSILDDKNLEDVFDSLNDTSIGGERANLYVDENYEYEIKMLLLMTLSKTDNITEDVITEYMPACNTIWNYATKLTDVNVFLKEHTSGYETALIIAPEYYINDNRNDFNTLSFEKSIAIDFFVLNNEKSEIVINDNDFMSVSCLRNDEYDENYNEGNLKNADWTTKIIHNSDLEKFDLPDEKIDDTSENENVESENDGSNIAEFLLILIIVLAFIFFVAIIFM